MLAGHLELTESERAEVDRLCNPGDPRVRAGLDSDATDDDVRAAALAGVERWRARAGNPLSDRRLIEAAEIVSRAYEGIYAGAG